MKRVILYGGGGHAKVVKECLDAQRLVVEGFMDDDPKSKLFDVPYLGIAIENKNDRSFLVSIGNNKLRKKVSEQLSGSFINAIHPTSLVSQSSKVGTGCMILHRSIVQAECSIGDHVIINTAAQVDHDCLIEDFAHIGPGAILCGNVSIGEGTLVGAGAVVLPGIKIGKWVTIGAGSIVTRNVDDHSVVIGNPAKEMSK